MPRAKLKNWVIFACLPISVGAHAQFTLTEDLKKEEKSEEVLKGKAAFDLVPLSSEKFSFALKYGHIVKNSESVDLAGRTLKPGVDYSMDYTSGTIFLKIKFRPGDTLTVRYRYDEEVKQDGTYGVTQADASAFTLTIAPGTKAILGLGMTERLANGSTLQSNVFGLNNGLKLAGGELNGVFLVSNREKSNTRSMFGDDRQGGNEVEGQGTAIIQNYSTKAAGGTLSVNYQDIDEKFTGFSSFASAGYDQKQIQMFSGEKGLKRTGFALTDAKLGDVTFGLATNTVGNADGNITWRNYSLGYQKATFSYSSQYVDEGFTKFNGLREDDRKQLSKERGLRRDVMSLNAPFNYGKANFNSLVVESVDGSAISRQDFSIETPWINGSFFSQSVDVGFSRFNDLREKDKKQLAKEGGIDRNGFNVASNLGTTKVNYSESSITHEDSNMRAMDWGIAGSNWGVAYSYRSVDKDFSKLRNLDGSDVNQYVNGILGMYSGNVKANNNDRKDFYDLAGFQRDGLKLNYSPTKSTKIDFNSLNIEGQSGNISVTEFGFATGNTTINYRQQNSSTGFNESHRLLNSEQKILGTIDGLNRRDFSFDSKLGGKSLNFSLMEASVGEDGAVRHSASYKDKGFNLSYNKRSVDQDFRDVIRLVDKENKHMSQFLGYNETEISGDWIPTSNVSLSYRESDAYNSLMEQGRFSQQMAARWNLNPATTIQVSQNAEVYSENGEDLIDRMFSQFNLSHKLNSSSSLSFTHQKYEFSGSEEDLPDATTNGVAYETKISKSTSFRTEHSETKFDNGERETTSSNTIATEITPRIGVSVTDTRINRDGDKPDETHRNYGAYIDFGSGIKLEYGYKRDIQGDDGKLNSSTKLSGGQAGGIKIGGGSYVRNRHDGRRDTHLGDVSFSNVNPFKLGSFSDIKFFYETNTKRDYFAWKKEDLKFGASAAYGKYGFGYEYTSQISPNGLRAIDRVFNFTTDKENKDRLVGTFKYGVRTMPDDENIMIRDYKVKYQVNNNLLVEHALITNPTQNKNNALLGSVPIDERRAVWSAKYQNDPSTIFDLNWSEIKRNRQSESLKREARLNLTLFADNPSPLKITYGMQQWDRNGNSFLSHSFGLSFTQRPGPNQAFSFSVENYHYGAGRTPDSKLHNWGMRLDYQWRF